jgi:hypothetical protein
VPRTSAPTRQDDVGQAALGFMGPLLRCNRKLSRAWLGKRADLLVFFRLEVVGFPL